MRSVFLSLAILIVAAFAITAHARIMRSDEITTAPPSPVYEVEMAERPGYILTPGYWRWDGSRHIWQHSRWIAEREGYDWVPDRWEQRGDKWQLAEGHWVLKDGYIEVAEEEPVITAAVEPAPVVKKPLPKKRKHVRKIDYNDPNLYPRVRRH